MLPVFKSKLKHC